MPTRKPGFTRRQHVGLGEKLLTARNDVLSAVVALSNAYPVNSRAQPSGTGHVRSGHQGSAEGNLTAEVGA